MNRHSRSLLVVCALAGVIAGCGYYNTMYNANKSFAEATRAEARGDQNAAKLAYRRSIEKASSMATRHPGSRWADDAQLLKARAELALGELDAAWSTLTVLMGGQPSRGT